MASYRTGAQNPWTVSNIVPNAQLISPKSDVFCALVACERCFNLDSKLFNGRECSVGFDGTLLLALNGGAHRRVSCSKNASYIPRGLWSFSGRARNVGGWGGIASLSRPACSGGILRARTAQVIINNDPGWSGHMVGSCFDRLTNGNSAVRPPESAIQIHTKRLV